MAVCRTTWTVLPHDPLQRLSDDVWRVEQQMDERVRRIMTLVRLNDGRVLIHNAIALEDELMAAIDAWGEVAAILVPNAFHRMDCRIMQERYPKAKVYAPAAAAKAVEKATPVHGTYADVPQDTKVRVAHLPGIKDKEGVVEVQGSDGPTVIFNDMVMNIPAVGFPMNVFLGPTGQVSIPRFARWLFASDKGALRKDLQRIADSKPARLVPGHGKDVVGDVATPLREAIALL
jgi:hypothetical protein